MKKFIVRFLTICFALVLVNSEVSAQGAQGHVTIQGRVLGHDKKPLPGVTVAEVDAEQRTVRAVTTDVQGNYAIRIDNKADSLSFSYIGNETIMRSIGNQTSVNVTMATANAGLGEVVVFAQKRTDNGMMPIRERDV